MMQNKTQTRHTTHARHGQRWSPQKPPTACHTSVPPPFASRRQGPVPSSACSPPPPWPPPTFSCKVPCAAHRPGFGSGPPFLTPPDGHPMPAPFQGTALEDQPWSLTVWPKEVPGPTPLFLGLAKKQCQDRSPVPGSRQAATSVLVRVVDAGLLNQGTPRPTGRCSPRWPVIGGGSCRRWDLRGTAAGGGLPPAGCVDGCAGHARPRHQRPSLAGGSGGYTF